MSKVCIPIPSSTIIGVSTTPIQTPSVNILRVEPQITGLDGGGATKLDGINTISGSYAVGICIFLILNNIPHIYQLVEGTDQENLPFIVRPNDYDNQTGNKRVWKQIM